MVYYKLFKVIFNAPKLAKVSIDVIVWDHGLSQLIMSNRKLVFNSKFSLSLYYFLEIKQKLPIAFHPQTYGQTKRQNSIMEAYLRGFFNYK